MQHAGRQGVQVWRRETETRIGLQDAGPGAREQGCGEAGATDLVIVAIVQDDCTRAWVAIERHVGSACACKRAVRQARLPRLGCFRGARAASRIEPHVFVGPSLRGNQQGGAAGCDYPWRTGWVAGRVAGVPESALVRTEVAGRNREGLALRGPD